MRKIVRIVSDDEYKDWVSQQQSYYLSSVRGTEEDPRKNELLGVEIQQRKQEFNDAVDKALSAEEAAEKIIRLKYVNFETGSANLTALSRYELDNLVTALNKYSAVTIEVAGHTDNNGAADANMLLSQNRAASVYNYLIDNGIAAERLRSAGYGQNNPVDSNDTDEGRANNRRTEFKILTQ
jgi:cytochrome c oxidase subunit 2